MDTAGAPGGGLVSLKPGYVYLRDLYQVAQPAHTCGQSCMCRVHCDVLVIRKCGNNVFLSRNYCALTVADTIEPLKRLSLAYMC